jgi:L-ascorbate metabolism protein UlaG (beta-lactamase superfamily)
MPASKTDRLLNRLRWLGGAGFHIQGRLSVYIDPCGVPDGSPAADIVLLTHPHEGHCSLPDVMRISKPQTIVVGPVDCVCRFSLNQLALLPGQTQCVLGLNVTGTPAYSLRDARHPKEAGWLGFIVELEDGRVFHPGDTDLIPEHSALRADGVLLPAREREMPEAASLVRILKAKFALPRLREKP